MTLFDLSSATSIFYLHIHFDTSCYQRMIIGPGSLVVTAMRSAQKKAGTKADCLELPTAGSSAQKKADCLALTTAGSSAQKKSVMVSDNCILESNCYNMRNLPCIHPVLCLK